MLVGPPTGGQEHVSAGLLTGDQTGLVAVLWCWDTEPLGHWAAPAGALGSGGC